MAQATFSIRMDEGIKRQFDSLCSDLGTTAANVIDLFARRAVKDRKLPFVLTVPEPEVTREGAMRAFKALRAEAKRNGLQDMSLDEINEEIRLSRIGR